MVENIALNKILFMFQTVPDWPLGDSKIITMVFKQWP